MAATTETAVTRFDYVEFDDEHTEKLMAIKAMAVKMSQAICDLGNGRATALAQTALEESYMWCGKAVRDSQIAKNGGAELQESRGDG